MVNLSDYFNNNTLRGRANIAKATYASLAGIFIYYRYIRKKPEKAVSEKNHHSNAHLYHSNGDKPYHSNGDQPHHSNGDLHKSHANGNHKPPSQGHEAEPHNGDDKMHTAPATPCPPTPCIPPPVKCENTQTTPQITAIENINENENLLRIKDFENILVWSPW